MISITPTVSVIVPIYNVAEFLPECIKSVLNQTFKDFELILVDDGSTDVSGQICDQYAKQDERIIVVHKQNRGLTNARNSGLEKATGEWIMHLDGDDFLEENAIQDLINQASKDRADVVIGDYRVVSESSEPLYRWTMPQWSADRGGESLSRYISSWNTPVWSSLSRAKIYRDNHLLSPPNICILEDFHLMVRLCYYAERIVNCRSIIYNYRQRHNSILHTKNNNRINQSLLVYADISSFFEHQGVYDVYERALNWRILCALKDLLKSPSGYSQFKELYKGKIGWILNCPFLNRSMKIKAFLLSCHCTWALSIVDNIVRLDNPIWR